MNKQCDRQHRQGCVMAVQGYPRSFILVQIKWPTRIANLVHIAYRLVDIAT